MQDNIQHRGSEMDDSSTHIHEYRKLLEDECEPIKVTRLTTKYKIIDKELYHQRFSTSYLKCVAQEGHHHHF